MLLLNERSGGVDRDEVGVAKAFAGDDHRIVVLEHGHVRDHRVSDDERRRALRQPGDLRLVENDRNRARVGARRRSRRRRERMRRQAKGATTSEPSRGRETEGLFRSPMMKKASTSRALPCVRRQGKSPRPRQPSSLRRERRRTARAPRRHGTRRGRLRHAVCAPRHRPRPGRRVGPPAHRDE